MIFELFKIMYVVFLITRDYSSNRYSENYSLLE